MRFPSLKDSVRVVTALTLISLLPASGLAQTSTQEQPATQTVQTAVPSAPSAQKEGTAYNFTDYTKPRTHFPNLIAPYKARSVDAPNLANTPRIDQVMQNGKIMLSLDDAISIALENNLDIAIARFNLPIADTDILLANAGQSTRGVNTGVVQGTPGGGVNVGLSGTSTSGSQGGGAGGTTAGAGGAGTGSAGIVTSTLGVGATVPSFDPIVTGTLQIDRSNSPATSAFAGIPLINQNTSTVDFAYTQGFHTGTVLSVGFNNSRVTTNSPFSTLSPTVNSNFRATLSQPILQGFGFMPNTRFIRIAKNNREISDVAFRLQVITSINQIENIYWDLVNAYENVKVQQDSLALAQKTLGDNQKQVQIGTLAPIEVVRAQSVVATDQQALIVAQTNLELQQLLMKNALSRTLVDPRLAEAEVIPTSTMQVPANEPVVPIQDLINDALSHRAELAESRIDLTNRDLNSKSARNALLPTLSVFAYYGGTGLGGTPNAAGIPCTPTSTSFCVDPNTPHISYGGTVGQLFDSSYPDKGAGLQLNIPLRNRAAQANQVRAELEYRQAQMRLQQLENQIRIEVRNAQFSVQQNRASVEAAQAAVELGKQSLDAEQKKYALGASTTTLVLQNQRDLTQAQSNLVAAKAAYEKARVELDRATGLTLVNNGILLSDAVSGQVTKQPSVPYAAPRQDVSPQSPASQGQTVMPPPQSIESAPADVQSAPGVVNPSRDVQPPSPQAPTDSQPPNPQPPQK